MTKPNKTVIQSKTILGGVLAILPLIDLALSGMGVIPAGGITASETAIVAAVGGLLSIYGRLTADSAIQGLLSPPRKAHSEKRTRL